MNAKSTDMRRLYFIMREKKIMNEMFREDTRALVRPEQGWRKAKAKKKNSMYSNSCRVCKVHRFSEFLMTDHRTRFGTSISVKHRHVLEQHQT